MSTHKVELGNGEGAQVDALNSVAAAEAAEFIATAQMNQILELLVQNPLLVTVAVAIIGWAVTVRLRQSLLRRQHTFSAIMDAHFKENFQEANKRVRPYVRDCLQLPDFSQMYDKTLEEEVRFLLNHYEFLAAGVRVGDVDERLLKQCEEDTILGLYEISGDFIKSVRGNGKWPLSYENGEWLCNRWRKNPLHWTQRTLEWILGQPFYHNWHFWRWIAGAATVIAILAVVASFLNRA